MRNSMPVEQPAFYTVQYDLTAIKYKDPHLWNSLDNQTTIKHKGVQGKCKTMGAEL